MNEWMIDESHHDETLYGGLFVDKDRASVTLMADPKATHLLPVLVNQWNEAILRRVSGDPEAVISVHSEPLPASSTSMEAEMMDLGRSLMTVLVVSMSFAFLPTSFASQIVSERESTVKHQQFMAGMRVSSYWIANLLFDVALFLIPCLLSGGVLSLFGVGLFGDDQVAVMVVLVMLALSVLSLTYLLSFLFVNPQSAQTILGRVYEMSGLILLIIGIMMGQLMPSGAVWWVDVLLFVFRCFPNYAFGEGLFNLSYARQRTSIMDAVTGSGSGADAQINVWEWNILGRNLCFMAAMTVFNLTAIAIVESITMNARLRRWFDRKRYGVPLAEYTPLMAIDDDVLAEAERVESGQSQSASSMEVMALRKVYRSKRSKAKAAADRVDGHESDDDDDIDSNDDEEDGRVGDGVVAVDGLSFAVGHSEVFGLIGSNGAGKSSTLKMLSKEVVPTSGTAFFQNGRSGSRLDILDSDYRSFFGGSHLGYCRQSESAMDGLMPLMTGREHLDFYCRIRGYSQRDCRLFVDTLMAALNLTAFADVAAGTYSGGNRRKLCVGIALIGNPTTLLLDEPSTGIDPISRRFLWNLIRNLTRSELQNRSVLLTTHSMEEAEALCDRIAIMDRANLQCLGTAQHLKTKFCDVGSAGSGGGYRLFIKLEDGTAEGMREGLKGYILQFVAAELAEMDSGNAVSIELLDDDGVTLTFCIRRSSQRQSENVGKQEADRMPLGKVFGFVESVKSKYRILEYSLSQNTLEQVFMDLVS